MTTYTSINDAVSQNNWLTPPRIAQAYNMPNNTGKGVKIGIFSLGGGWSSTDFNNSMRDLSLDSLITSSKIKTVLIDGATGTMGSDFDAENTLDLYCVAGMAPEADITIYIGVSTGAFPYSQSWVNILNRMIDDGCDIITMSYAISESYLAGDFLSEPLARAASLGILVLASSGDNGSLGGAFPSDSSYSLDVSAGYPASSPYVLAIGGTHLTLNSDNSILSETAEIPDFVRPKWGSAGGVSTIFTSVPTWQATLSDAPELINRSTNIVLKPGLESLEGRGVPDFSGPMNYYVLWMNNTVTLFAGTSASCPIIAGMLARFISRKGNRFNINSLQTIFYNNPSAFNDITVGDNATDNISITINALYYTKAGYTTTPAWDSVTGLGSPKGDKLFKLLVNGNVFPKVNNKTRPTSGVTYPRTQIKIRQ